MPIKKTDFSYTMNLRDELKDVPQSKRFDVKEKIGKYIIKQINKEANNETSAVTGRRFKRLSKAYAAIKKKKRGNSKANLKLDKNMLPSLDFSINGNKLKVSVTESKEKLKAFNHNTGDTLPKRQFMPDEKSGSKLTSTFKPSIRDGIDQIIKEAE